MFKSTRDLHMSGRVASVEIDAVFTNEIEGLHGDFGTHAEVWDFMNDEKKPAVLLWIESYGATDQDVAFELSVSRARVLGHALLAMAQQVESASCLR